MLYTASVPFRVAIYHHDQRTHWATTEPLPETDGVVIQLSDFRERKRKTTKQYTCPLGFWELVLGLMFQMHK